MKYILFVLINYNFVFGLSFIILDTTEIFIFIFGNSNLSLTQTQMHRWAQVR